MRERSWPACSSERAAVASRLRSTSRVGSGAFNQLVRRRAVFTFVFPVLCIPLLGRHVDKHTTFSSGICSAAKLWPPFHRIISRPTIVTNSCRSRANGIVVRCLQQQLQEQLSPTSRQPFVHCELSFWKDRLGTVAVAKLLARLRLYIICPRTNESRYLYATRLRNFTDGFELVK